MGANRERREEPARQAGKSRSPRRAAAAASARGKANVGIVEDVRTWVRSIGLQKYETVLMTQYENVSQIVSLYGASMPDFFEDNGIETQDDQKAFERAVRSILAASTA